MTNSRPRPLIVADRYIPFLQGRLEPFADIRYIDPEDFSPDIVRDADGMLIRTRTRCNEQLLANSRVHFIATGTIGMDQIDIPYCRARGIEVYNAPGCNAPGVAQYVWAALLHHGIDPKQTTLGIVGCGNVGRVVAEWAGHLGASMLINDTPRQGASEPGPWQELDFVLANSDVVSLHVPLTHDGSYPTYHLIGDREIALMRPGAILINAARGSVVDNQAMADAVREGHIRAIVDTWEGEPDHINADLLSDAIYATPHIAGYSLEGKQRATRMILEAAGQHFGFEGIDYSGLADRYRPLPGITAEQITSSYDPAVDTARLRQAPDTFEAQRDGYDYRNEPEVNE